MTSAIVILGAAVWADERPSPTLERRVNKAINLWRTGNFQLIVPSGGLGKHPPTEAEVMRRLLLAASVPDSAIFLEKNSTSTLTNAVFSAALLKARDVQSISVVTDGFHRCRSYLSFRRLGFSVTAISADDAQPSPRWQLVLSGRLRECFALPVYLVRLYLRPLPYAPTERLHPPN